MLSFCQKNRDGQLTRIPWILGTPVAAVGFMPLTFIAGIDGIKFRYMHTRNGVFGYSCALLVTLLRAACSYGDGRCRGWS